jgi:hypothetical protein
MAIFIFSVMGVKNSGQTPAYEVIHWGGLDVRRIDEEPLLIALRPLLRQGMNTIPPGGVITKTLHRAALLSEAEINGIIAGSYAIYIWGRIEYKDAFDRDRFTNYRLKFTGQYPPPAGVTMTFCDGGNETDEHYG